jgi:hypothetical protein
MIVAIRSKEVIIIDNEQENLRPKHSKADSANPKHIRKESLQPKHVRAENRRPRILRTIIAVELILVILACGFIYRLWCHNFEVRIFGKVCSVTLASASESMNDHTNIITKTYMESVAEEVFEYVWTTEKIEYRTGADISYKSAGKLDKDKMVRRTGITHNGWSRIALDEGEFYIPEGTLSADIPDSLPIAAGVKGEYQKYALSLLPDFGWDSSELEPLIYLWNRESGWNPNSHNKRSGAHGIPQALPAKKMASEGSDYYTNAEPQIRWGLKYIARRYGSPSNAWRHFCSRGWY